MYIHSNNINCNLTANKKLRWKRQLSKAVTNSLRVGWMGSEPTETRFFPQASRLMGKQYHETSLHPRPDI
jgi:isopropylmalate/homocitrate/citramalate synthase